MKQDIIQEHLFQRYSELNILPTGEEGSLEGMVELSTTIGNLATLIDKEAGEEILKAVEGDLKDYQELVSNFKPSGSDSIKRQVDYVSYIGWIQAELKTTLLEEMTSILANKDILR